MALTIRHATADHLMLMHDLLEIIGEAFNDAATYPSIGPMTII